MDGVTYGKFLSAIINFLVVGTVLFFVIKSYGKKPKALLKKEETVEEAPAGQLNWKYFKKSKLFLRKIIVKRI